MKITKAFASAPLLLLSTFLFSNFVSAQSTEEMKTRISELHKIQAEYIKQIADGKVKPFEELQKDLSDNATKIAEAKQGYEEYLALKEGSDERAAAGAKLQLLVNELRRFLQFAEHPPGLNAVNLSSDQVAELKKINAGIKTVRETPADPEQRMSLYGLNERATFLFLPVPIAIQAPKGKTVYLRSSAGGVFENGMPSMAVQADDNGLVSTYWITNGNGVADCHVEIIGESIAEDEWMTIKVVQPLAIDLPQL